MAISDYVGVTIIIYNIFIWTEKCEQCTHVESSLQSMPFGFRYSFFIYHLNCWIFSWINCVITTHQDIPIPDTRPINGTLEWQIAIECRQIKSNRGNILPSINFNGIFWSDLRSIRQYLEIMMSRIVNLTVAQSHSSLADACPFL